MDLDRDVSFADLQRLVEELERLQATGQDESVIAFCTKALVLPVAAHSSTLRGLLHDALGMALWRSRGPDEPEVVEHLRHGAALGPTSKLRAWRLLQLGIAYHDRTGGDRDTHIARAVEAYEEAEALVVSTDPPLCAFIRSNLASAVAAQAAGIQVGPDQDALLRRAQELCRTALGVLTREDAPDQWAETMVTLGDLVAATRDGTPEGAIAIFTSVIASADRIADPVVVARAHMGAAFTGGDDPLWSGGSHPATPDMARARQIEVRRHLEAAVSLLHDAGRVELSKAAVGLATVCAALGDADAAHKALKVSRQAALRFRDQLHLRTLVDFLWSFGAAHAQLGEWESAAEAHRAAVAGALLLRQVAPSRAARLAALRHLPTLNRWAALTLARAGRPMEAALTLEVGRTGEFDARMAESEGRSSPADTSDRSKVDMSRVIADFRQAAVSGEPDDPRIGFREALSDLVAFERWFNTGLFESAAPPGAGIVYVNPTPQGTMILVVTMREGRSSADAHPIFRPVTGTEIMHRIHFGHDQPFATSSLQTGPSYTVAVLGHGPLAPAIEYLFPWVGAHIAREIAASARDLELEALTLVISGPLAYVPLGSCAWQDPDGPVTRLTDVCRVTYAPSARILASCRQPATVRVEDLRLVAVADPRTDHGPLTGAGAEVTSVATLFGDRARVRYGAQATRAFLLDEGARATHIHAACHARGDIADFTRSTLILADGELGFRHLRAADWRPSLVVLSACQTGVADITLQDEAFSIGTFMLASGAACVLASLWEVDDYATAVLMTRFYEELLPEPGTHPATALAAATSWMRRLTAPDHAEYIRSHHALGEAFSDDGAAFWRWRAARYDTLFADPEYWAGFVVAGA